MNFKKIAIVGLGLLGGSIIKTIQKKAKNKIEIFGYGSPKSTEFALQNKLIDKTYNSFDENISQYDLIILCTPVSIIIKQLEEIKPFLNHQTIITDVGSTKKDILAMAKKLQIKNFVGSHPIAGSEKSGIQNSLDNLFEGKLSIICHNNDSDDKNSTSTKQLKEFWEFLGCKVQFLGGKEHDKAFAFISHFPHLLSTLLMNQGEEFISKNSYSSNFYGQGFKNMTQLAKGNKDMWKDIFKTNKNFLQETIYDFQQRLETISKMIQKEDWQEIEFFFAENKKYREKIT